MRALVILILTIICHLTSSQHDHGIRVGWLNLPVDHFSTNQRLNWDIRYFINDEHYVADGPIFIYIGGTHPAYTDFIQTGNVFEIAQETGGVLLSLEHRYFGESRPTLDTSFENLQWLTIHQVVADIGRFASFMRQRYNDAPVILFGRGYAGSLAVWARQKYPNVIDGAWASSAPLNAIVEDFNYFPNVQQTISNIGGPECTQIIADAFQIIEDAFEAGNVTFIEERFRLCEPLDIGNSYDITRFQYQIAREIGENFLSHASYAMIDEKCIIMRGLDQPDNPPMDALDAFARWFVDDFNRERECMYGTNAEHVRIYQDPAWDSISTLNGYRQALWLNCVQRGAFPVANNGQDHPFGRRFDLRFFEQWCVDAFGSDIFLDPWFMQDTINSVNRNFGGLNPAIYRIFLTHGEMDPIRSLGPNRDINQNSPVVVMSLQSHSRDMGSPDDTDNVVLQNTKIRVRETILEWIQYAREGEPQPPPPPAPPAYETRWFNLPLDHFSTGERRNWDVRYLLNENVYRENGPIFIFIGGPEYIPEEWILRGNIFDVAQTQGGVLAALEMRYFGLSRPTADTSFENLRWLTISQSVADIGRFAAFMKRRYLEAPVIVWGRGFGGSLAVWARQKYPNVIDGAWASSAPLNAILEDLHYFPNIHQTISNIGGPECTQIITDAFRIIEDAFDAGNMTQVEERLRVCQPLDTGNGYDIARLQYQIAREIGENFVSHASYPMIDEKCIIMRGLDQPDNPPIDALDAFARWYVDDFNRERECMYGTNEEVVRIYQDPAWDSISTLNGYRQALWLNCVQRGAFSVANNGQDHPFGTRFDMNFMRRWCVEAFDNDIFLDPWWMEDTINSVNRNFGGLNPAIYRIFLTHGEMDPIRSLGPNRDINQNSPVVVMSLQAHSRDMGSPDDTDYVVLQETKRRVQQAVYDWIEYARHGDPQPPPPPAPPQFTTHWFNLPLDHFSTSARTNWDIRYLLNENVYRENGPVFIFIGSGEEISPEWILRGNIFDVAQTQGGVLAALEMRYFGQSRPTLNATFENLQWLTISQAVADIGRFASFMRQRYLEAPVIVWGSGLGGSLAVWARQKYPNVIDGAWASSAPINAILEDTNYFANVFRTINNIGGPECGEVIREAFQLIEEHYEAGDTSYVEERLRLCQPIDIGNGYDIARLQHWIAQDIGRNFVSNSRYPDIDEKCIIMRGLDAPDNPAVDALDAFARWYVDDFNRERTCLQLSNEEYVRQYQAVQWNEEFVQNGQRQRLWLNCVQLGQFSVANNGQDHPFGTRFDMNFMRRWCADAFGNDIFFDPWWMEDTINSVNRNFGGLNPAIYRIFLTHGEMDPIRSLGPSNDINQNSPVVVMPMQSHARDLGSPDDTDYVVLQETKRRVQQAVYDWIEYARHGEPQLPPPPAPPQFTTHWFNLPLDHFSTSARSNWDIRYLLNENVYRENGPIFIFIGSGEEISPEWILRGNIFDVAQTQGGVLAALEMRYFGQSRPTLNATFENLQWLTISQAVADIGRFASFMRQRYLEAPVIVWGSGLGGSLAVWARQKYPNVIDGAWASSAPINAILEDTNYFANVFRTINNIGGPECGEVIREAFQLIEEHYEAGDTSYVEERLRLCQPIDIGNGYDIARLQHWIAQDIGRNFVSNSRYPDIDEKCIIMRGLDAPDNPAVDALDAFAKWYVDDFNRERTCLQLGNEEYVRQYQAVQWNEEFVQNGQRQRFWLNCVQLGQFSVANNGQDHPFGTRFDMNFMRRWCADAFGNDIFLDQWWMEDTINSVNRNFGGLNPAIYRIFLTYGEMDPIRSLGPSNDINQNSPVVVMPMQSHARDLGSPDDTDYVVLQETKRRVQEAVFYWIEYARYGELPAVPYV